MQIINIDIKDKPIDANINDIYIASVPNPDYCNAVPVTFGLKIKCNKEMLDHILSEQYMKENFTLNIKKVNENVFNIYFDKKHDNLETQWF